MLWGPIRMCCSELHEWQFPNQCWFTVRSVEPTLAMNMLRSFKILFCLVLEAGDTSDSPLLRSFCVLASSIVGNVQFGTGPKLEL